MSTAFEYADIVLPVPLNQLFTYRIPPPLNGRVEIGSRVMVPFGKKKIYTGVVLFVHNTPPDYEDIKSIQSLCDDRPIALRNQLRFWQWMSEYYLAPIGDVYRAALPSGLLNEDDTIAYIPRRRTFVREAFNRYDEEKLRDVFTQLRRSPKQEKLMLHYFQLTQSEESTIPLYEIAQADLLSSSGASTTVLKGLYDKQILQPYEKEISRLSTYLRKCKSPKPLTNPQLKAYRDILHGFREHPTVLLHGVTSSGKTEIYIHLIRDVLSLGKQVLFLLPEIALTTQLTERLQEIFGNRLGVYHSKFSNAERTEMWFKQLSDQPFDVIIGARSGLFLPYRNLGLIIVDEEHETSFKQHDPAPRYHARNAALLLASYSGAKTLLGSATPSLESYYFATNGKYGLVELTTRFADIEMPRIEVVDVKELRRRKEMRAELISPPLFEAMQQALKAGEQIILFQNRRGFSPYIECPDCNWVPRCTHCDVSLTYHHYRRRLVCHYCGSNHPAPASCPACNESRLATRGSGTEKIEDEVITRFPGIPVLRMDLDTTRGKTAFETIIDEFAAGKARILVGTQMVAKGLDFAKVSIVGILNADQLFNYPDFRAHERAFQLLAQVSGRSGRSGKQGRVFLQTYTPNHPLLQKILNHDYRGMYEQEIIERTQFFYPPHFRILYLYLKHRDELLIDHCAAQIATRLRTKFGNRILGPDVPLVGKVQTLHIRKIIIKMEIQLSATRVKQTLREETTTLLTDPKFKTVQFYFDVDPI